MLTVRRVLHHEYSKYREHLKALDPDSRHLRFGYPVSNDVIDRLCDLIEQNIEQHILFCVENQDLEFIAVGHIATSHGMELAFSVFKEYQGQGLGSALMDRCIRWCRTKGILKGCMVCLSHNKTIQHLCKKHGIHIHTDHGEVLADVELDSPSLETFVKEQMASNIAVMDYLTKRSALSWSFK
jgi:GNAT superfamily N-acetyltransferase